MIKSLLYFDVKKIQSIVVIVLSLACIMPKQAQASIKSYKKSTDGVTFALDKGLLKVLVRKADIIEIKYTLSATFETKPSLVVNNGWKTPVPYQLTENKNEVIITTAKLRVRVNKTTNAIT